MVEFCWTKLVVVSQLWTNFLRGQFVGPIEMSKNFSTSLPEKENLSHKSLSQYKTLLEKIIPLFKRRRNAKRTHREQNSLSEKRKRTSSPMSICCTSFSLAGTRASSSPVSICSTSFSLAGKSNTSLQIIQYVSPNYPIRLSVRLDDGPLSRTKFLRTNIVHKRSK